MCSVVCDHLTDHPGMQKLFPESKEAELMHYKIFKDKRATPLLDPKTNSSRPDTKSKIENLYLAGDWTNTGLPATIESAALSGKKAVESVINDFDKAPRNQEISDLDKP